MKRKTEIKLKAVVLLIAVFMVFPVIPTIVDANEKNTRPLSFSRESLSESNRRVFT